MKHEERRTAKLDRARNPAAAWSLILAVIASPSYAARLFVDAAAQGNQSGISWNDAFTDLQPALSSASTGDEIWVACATYLPSERLDASDPRSATFNVTSGISILGGFSGGEVQSSQRNPDPRTNGCALGETPLSGTGFDGFYHIVRIESVVDPALIDGFTITGGRATGDTVETQTGGGARIVNSAAILRNIRFHDVTTRTDGPGFGGAVFAGNSDVRMENIEFSQCNAGRGGGIAAFSGQLTAHRLAINGCRSGFGGGAALFARGSASIELSDSFLENNAGNNNGGAIVHEGSGPLTIRRSIFLGNRAFHTGGAVLFEGTRLLIENSAFVGNALSTGSRGGGAIWVARSASATIINSTIAHNEAGSDGSGVLVGGSATLAMQNSLVHGNVVRTPSGATHQIEAEVGSNALIAVAYSIVEGGFPGIGNMDVAPQFVRTPSSGDGSWVSIQDNDFGDVRLLATSLGIDAGNNLAEVEETDDGVVTAADLAFDADRQRRLLDTPGVPDTGVGGPPVIDIGAYEFVIDGIFQGGFEQP